MAENLDAYLDGLQRELAYETAKGRDDRVKAIKKEIGRVRKQIGGGSQVETAAATPPETAAKPAAKPKGKK